MLKFYNDKKKAKQKGKFKKLAYISDEIAETKVRGHWFFEGMASSNEFSGNWWLEGG